VQNAKCKNFGSSYNKHNSKVKNQKSKIQDREAWNMKHGAKIRENEE